MTRSDRKRAEAASAADAERLAAENDHLKVQVAVLRAMEQRFRATLYGIGDAVIVTDVHANIQQMNRVAETLTGWKEAEALGKPAQQVFRIVNAETRAEAESPIARAIRDGAATGLANHTLLIARDGTERAVADSAAPIRDESGRVTGVVLVFRDVTEARRLEAALQQSEARYRSFFDLSADLVCIADINGHFRSLNPSWTRVLGYSLKELQDKPFLEFVHPEDRDKTLRVIREKLERGETVLCFENRYLRKDGQVVWLEWTSQPNVSEGQTFAIARDITERRRAEETLQRVNQELARSNQDLEQFAYAASHDLQEPLRKVAAFGSLLDEEYADKLGDEGRQYVRTMQNATQRMQGLISDLLTFSRVSTRGSAFAAVDLNETVRDVLSDLEVCVRETKAEVDVGHLPTVRADATQMRQLLQNLIGNALKFHKDGEPPRVKVDAEVPGSRPASAEGSPPPFCRLTVEDNGIGFDPQYAERIFGLFQRLHRRQEYSGSGIGLAVCRRIVERHGGTITAGSKPGEGARFVATLPLARAAVQTEG